MNYRTTVDKNARDLRVGDEILLNNVTSFIIESMEPSPLTGWGAPVIIGTYHGLKPGPGRIDLGSNPKLTDHIFEVVPKH